MGKKHIIEIEDDRNIIETFGGKCTLAVSARLGNTEVFIDTNIPIVPYAKPDLDAVRKEAYDKGFEDGREYCPGQLSCMDATYQKGFMDGTKQCVNCEDFKESAKAEAYRKGLNDSWECARKVVLDEESGGLDMVAYCEIFGYGKNFRTVLKTFSASEVIEKIRQYEEKEEQIQVWDEVKVFERKPFIVTGFGYGDGDAVYCHGFVTENGISISAKKDECVKTGRSFPEIAEVMRKMKEG